ncbi:hypothetical protein [Aureispira sp. CCB-QB1]|uniref:hypothetical protein n=1 Tax=Aureispira sp. CCB-QB1 TaxID=1313421 RepID=UPI000696F643|nr:hypothetical protein [Aureispira sp. CCB-QB1]
MPLIILPFLAGAGATGYWWWSSSTEEKPTFSGELFKVLQPFLIILIVLLALRWLYKQGSTAKKK